MFRKNKLSAKPAWLKRSEIASGFASGGARCLENGLKFSKMGLVSSHEEFFCGVDCSIFCLVFVEPNGGFC